MSIVPQYSTVTSDGDGDAIFTFPVTPQGQVWCGTTNILRAPSTAIGIVTAGGSEVGSTVGNGSYGPWVTNYSQGLAISVTGLTPNTQYQAVWHVDTAAATFPAPITQVVTTTLVVPEPLEVDGTVEIGGTVETSVVLAASCASGQVAMTGATQVLPSAVATIGVIIAAAKTNTETIEIGAFEVELDTGFILDPGQRTPLLPLANLDILSAIGTSDDVLSYLVL